MGWTFLSGAIVAEVTATPALRASDGPTRSWPSVAVLVGYGLAIFLLARALRDIGVGAAYAGWSGLGTMGAAAGGCLLFAERLNVTAVFGMVLAVAGVAVMSLGGGVSHG